MIPVFYECLANRWVNVPFQAGYVYTRGSQYWYFIDTRAAKQDEFQVSLTVCQEPSSWDVLVVQLNTDVGVDIGVVRGRVTVPFTDPVEVG